MDTTPNTNHITHTRHLTATQPMDTTTTTNYVTHNRHTTATQPMNTTLNSPNPLSTPTSDRGAVPDPVR